MHLAHPKQTRLGPAAVHGSLGRWVDRPGALYVRLAEATSAAVDCGDLPRGARLPPERSLATELRVARGTVVAAYRLLQDRGLIERRQGSGTWIIDADASHTQTPEVEAGLRSRRLTDRLMDSDRDVIDLAISVLLNPFDLPATAFRPERDDIAKLAAGHGYHPLGLPALRERLAQIHTANGLPTEVSQIAITLGGQQAIALTADLLVTPGDHVVIESTTFPGAIDAYSRAGARFETIPTDTGGAQIGAAERAVERAAPRLLYVIPTCHNPTGTVMPAHRRAALAALADANDTWIVEDESLAWTAFFEERPPLPIAAYSRDVRVITIGSLSKLLWGGLRVGWIRADPTVIARIARLKAAHDLGNCAVSQVIALTLLEHVEENGRQLRARLQRGAALLSDQLARRLPGWTFRPPDGGLSLWVHTPGVRTDEFAVTALRHGVAVLPGQSASPRNAHPEHMRLSYTESPERITDGVQRLADAWTDHLETTGGAGTTSLTPPTLG